MTAWYAPKPRWTFSGGLAFYSNWIDQDITLGALSGGVTDPATSQWNYAGRSDTVNFGSTYAWTDRLTLSGGYEYVQGSNSFAPPPLWPDLPQYSDVVVTLNGMWNLESTGAVGGGHKGPLTVRLYAPSLWPT